MNEPVILNTTRAAVRMFPFPAVGPVASSAAVSVARRARRALAAIFLSMMAIVELIPTSARPQDTWSTCAPVADRAGRALGCYIVANQQLKQLPEGLLYWHLDIYPTRVAAEKIKGPNGTIVESYGSVWLFTIAEAAWRSQGGKHIADVGPLPLDPAAGRTATYMEATSTPGMQSSIHRHPGPEAWYVLAGEQCLETPEGKTIVRAGESGIVRGGPPMQLTATGTVQRRSLVLVLHDSSQHWASPAADWSPKGLCSH
jgi:quercetin dioxygenase-like cupin family protein